MGDFSVNIQTWRQMKVVSLTLLAYGVRGGGGAYTILNLEQIKKDSSLRFSKQIRTVSLHSSGGAKGSMDNNHPPYFCPNMVHMFLQEID